MNINAFIFVKSFPFTFVRFGGVCEVLVHHQQGRLQRVRVEVSDGVGASSARSCVGLSLLLLVAEAAQLQHVAQAQADVVKRFRSSEQNAERLPPALAFSRFDRKPRTALPATAVKKLFSSL